jgi:hypothetical protein
MNTVTDIPARRLIGVIQLWLWEFEEPANWPTLADARRMIEDLRGRPDASSREVRQGIRECERYIAEGG